MILQTIMNSNIEKKLLRFPHKELRAAVIKKYIAEAGYDKVVCFSCGNAAAKLEEAGVDVLHIGAKGVLEPHKWFTQAEIAKVFPGYFDATSGHLPAELMVRLAKVYKAYIGRIQGDTVYIPTGSGETLVCLKMAYPEKQFVAVYNIDKATEYDIDAPLNAYVRATAAAIIGI